MHSNNHNRARRRTGDVVVPAGITFGGGIDESDISVVGRVPQRDRQADHGKFASTAHEVATGGEKRESCIIIDVPQLLGMRYDILQIAILVLSLPPSR
jgi:hypothetical protein